MKSSVPVLLSRVPGGKTASERESRNGPLQKLLHPAAEVFRAERFRVTFQFRRIEASCFKLFQCAAQRLHRRFREKYPGFLRNRFQRAALSQRKDRGPAACASTGTIPKPQRPETTVLPPPHRASAASLPRSAPQRQSGRPPGPPDALSAVLPPQESDAGSSSGRLPVPDRVACNPSAAPQTENTLSSHIFPPEKRRPPPADGSLWIPFRKSAGIRSATKWLFAMKQSTASADFLSYLRSGSRKRRIAAFPAKPAAR